MSTTLVLLTVIVFFAAFQQTISGFGFALLVMPLATVLLGLRVAAPLIALAGLTLYAINLIRYHHSVNLREVLRLGTAAAIGVPVGIWGLVSLEEQVVKVALGLILIAFAIFSLLRLTWTRMLSARWVLLAGFATGCLGGAYNLPGPPLILYGSLRRWDRDEFRAVLQTLFFLTGLLTVISHLVAAHVTVDVLTCYAYAVPALVLGILLGARADAHINRNRFQSIVGIMILISGASLIVTGR